MSRSDSRQVSWENAITRNKSAQPSVRTPASPLWRSMMRPKVFHGTNSITCENSVLPTFMRYPGSFRPASIANRRSEIQIVDTHESLKTRADIGFPACQPRFNRTAVFESIQWQQQEQLDLPWAPLEQPSASSELFWAPSA